MTSTRSQRTRRSAVIFNNTVWFLITNFREFRLLQLTSANTVQTRERYILARIPIPGTPELLSNSAALGRRLADLLDAESLITLTAQWSFLAALKLPRNSELEEALKITAGWGRRGQGSTVMPGPGLGPAREWTAEREKLATLAAAQSLALENGLTLLGETCVDVHLNGDAIWSAVPANVWNYTLGGYQVLTKWLSYREFPLLGRALRSEEAAYVAQIVRRIAVVLLLGPSLDASYQAILPGATGLPTS